MPSNSLIQLAARLLPPDICAQIKAGAMPEHEVAYHLCILITDCDALTDTEKSTWTDRRLSKQIRALAGLVMLAFAKEDGS
jgi:hypothetical protein